MQAGRDFPLIPYANARVLYVLGCSLLAHGLEERSDDHVRRALALSRSLARIRIPYSRITGALLSGAANAALGRTREAHAAFEEAERHAREHAFRLHEAVARLRRAEQGGAAEGEALRLLEGEGIRDPWAAAYVLAPAVRRPLSGPAHAGLRTL